jgi:hypothetical protein
MSTLEPRFGSCRIVALRRGGYVSLHADRAAWLQRAGFYGAQK